MILSFHDRGTEDIFNGVSSRDANRACPKSHWRVAQRELDQLDSINRLEELKAPPGNRLEVLRGNRTGQHSIRINDQYRVCFTWTENSPSDVEVTDYH